MVSYDIDEERINKTEGLKYVFNRFGRDFSFSGFFLQGVLLDDNGEFRLTYSQHFKSDLEDRTYKFVFFLKDVDSFYDVHINTQKTVIEGIDIALDTLGYFIFSDKTNNINILCKDFRVEFHDILSEKFAIEKRDYLIRKYSQRYEDKICTLNDLKKKDGSFVFNRDDTYNGIKADRHIMYKLPSLHNEDGSIYYEFLIEFDKNDPCLGIYYGCKGLIKKGDNEEKIKELDEQWEKTIQEQVLERLNNLFPNKMFDNRFKPTDNANDNTYWPFWIPLYDDENVKEVAARATIIIRDEYKRVLENNYKADETSKSISSIKDVNTLKGELHSETSFTEESWESLKRPWVDKKANTPKKKKSETDIKLEMAEEIWEELLTDFVDSCKEEDLLVEDNDKFEKAFRWKCDKNQLSYMLNLLLEGPLLNKYREKYLEKYKRETEKLPPKVKVPWKMIIRSFLDQNGEILKESSIKTIDIDNDLKIKNTKALFERIMRPK